MPVPFYDNCLLPIEDDPSFVEVERIYCFDVDALSKEHLHRLNDIFGTLPGYQGVVDGSPMWFGLDEEVFPFLWASLEPPGLQVYGVVRPNQWKDWDTAFQGSISDFPFRREH